MKKYAPKLSGIIIESSKWAHRCCVWLSKRDYDIVIEPNITKGIEQLKNHHFDFILIDETYATKSHKSFAIVLQDFSQSFVISPENIFSTEGFKNVTNAGAKGYIKKSADEDTFIRELDKNLRKLLKDLYRIRVLIVDNDPDVLKGLKSFLVEESCDVDVASNEYDGRMLLEKNNYHIAVIDIRLRDDKDKNDRSGLELIKFVDETYKDSIEVIGITGSSDNKIPINSWGLAFAFLLKKQDSNNVDFAVLSNKIEKAFERLGINSSLIITFEEPLSFTSLVDMMKVYKHLSDEEKLKIVDEIEDLMRKIFFTELSVKGYYMQPGRGGSGVVRMRPVVQGTKGEHLVIKFGPKRNIITELEKYNLFVKPFLGRCSTTIVDLKDKPFLTRNLGGLKFTFNGMSVDEPNDFNTFYRNPITKEEEISKTITNIFSETCKYWYDGPRDWSDTNKDSLARSYENQLSLDTPEHQKEINQIIQYLLSTKNHHGISFTKKNNKKINIHINGTNIEYPSPYEYLKLKRNNFPTPALEYRTHGDLNGRNMFVDQYYRVWLIDFFKTDWGPAARDFAELETCIKFELIENNDFLELYNFEKELLAPGNFSERHTDLKLPPELNKAIIAIDQIHRCAINQIEQNELKEYYIALLYYTIKLISWEGISSSDLDRRPIRQRHAFMSAAMISYRLSHWDSDWPGWPDESHVKHIL